MSRSGKPGQPSKGDRAAHTVRTPRDHMNRYKAEAAARGLSVGDYLAVVLAEAHGLDAPAYLDRNRHQDALLTG